MKTCPHCGAKLKKRSSICPSCKYDAEVDPMGYGSVVTDLFAESPSPAPTLIRPSTETKVLSGLSEDPSSATSNKKEKKSLKSLFQKKEKKPRAPGGFGTLLTEEEMERNAAESFRIAALLDTPDDNDLISPRDIRANKDICMLCYLPFLFWFPLLSRPASRFARFHANQGMLLTLVSSCWWILEYTLTSYFNDELLYFLSILLGALNVFVLILIGFGIINCSNGLAKEMPLFGHFRIIETIKPLKEE